MRIALFGNGFIGREIARQIPVSDHINRLNYNDYKGCKFDIFINAIGNNRGYEVNKNPHIDCSSCICACYNTLFDFKINKYIYLSSIAVEDESSNYGFNKHIIEKIILRYANIPIILRCSSVIDKTSEIGLISDIIKRKELFVTPNSLYQFISRNDLIRIIKDIVDKEKDYNSVYKIGGIGSIRISDIEEIASVPIKYAENAIYRNYEMNVDDANKEFGLKTTQEYIRDIFYG